MLVVDADVVRVEQQLRRGELKCPSCGAVLAPWGHGRPREIRGDLGARLFLRPRRTRCSGCEVTHVLLAEVVVPRRVDAAGVIGAGLEIAALGMGTARSPRCWAGPRARSVAGCAGSVCGPRRCDGTSPWSWSPSRTIR
ncbi:DUF6431 domain-containing protein [Streptomyces alanosinicus]|uniref:DUF6431 domain-containing protein n=1 Tax=Streptomyces alanosinicus TaxID=68171 RepID=UPI0035716AC6